METESLAQELIAHINEILSGASTASNISLNDQDMVTFQDLQYTSVEKKDVSTQTAAGYWCHLCVNRSYIAKCSLNRHLESAHSQVRFACLYCDATYSRRSDLKKHGIKLHKFTNKKKN